MLKEEASLMSWEEFSLTKRKTSEFWIFSPFHPGHSLTVSKDIVGNSDLEGRPKGKKKSNYVNSSKS